MMYIVCPILSFMNKFKLFVLLVGLAVVMTSSSGIMAQKTESAADYMGYIGDRYARLNIEFYKYLSDIAHTKNARKIEQRRSELIALSWETYNEIRTMPAFNGDRSLRDSTAAYMKVNHLVMKEEFDKIIDMEAVAEQSANKMQAYLMAQRQARNKLDVANIHMLAEQKKFAARHHITLVDRQHAVYEKMQMTSRTLEFANLIYYIFFKSHQDETALLEAIKEKDALTIPILREKLLNSSREGLALLDKAGAFESDLSLTNACKDLLQFYEEEAATLIQDLIDYMETEEAFIAARTEFESNTTNARNPLAVETYNAAVKNMNTSVNQYNETSTSLHNERMALMRSWRETYDNFLKEHIPEF